MGGSALKNCILKRLPRPAYKAVEVAVLESVRRQFPRVEVPPYLDTKLDFGDVDLVCQFFEGWRSKIEVLAAEWSSAEVVTGPGTASLERDGFQIDLIVVPEIEFECSVDYFSYGDAGGILGQVAKNLGLKLGQKGLTIFVNDAEIADRKLGSVTLSRDYNAILPYLGYDAAVWRSGFRTETDLFQFLSSSPYASRDLWEPSGFDRDNRKRLLKRPSFQRWMEYVLMLPGKPLERTPPPDPFAYFCKEAERDSFIATDEENKRRLELARQTGGDVVMKVTGLHGRQLGDFLRFLKSQTTPKASVGREDIIALLATWKSIRHEDLTDTT